MAFIWKDQKSSTWYLDYTPPSGKRSRKRIGKSKQAAQLALKEIEYQLSFDRAGVSTPDMTLGDFLVRYEETTRPTLRARSWQRYGAIVEHFKAFLGPAWQKMKLQQLGREHFEQYLAWRRGGHGAFARIDNGNQSEESSTVKTKTINTELDMLASMLNKAVEWRYLNRNPVKSISRLKEDDRKPFRFFSTEEIEIIRLVADLLNQQTPRGKIDKAVNAFYREHKDLSPACAKSKDTSEANKRGAVGRSVLGWLPHGRTLVDFLLMTGSREDEVLNLQWAQVDLKRGIVSYRRREGWVPKETEREIALKPELVKGIKALPRSATQPYVFLDSAGKSIPPRTFERAIQKLIGLTRIPHATLHDFRHTFASHLAMAGVPLPTIQQLLGHRDIQTVMIYAHLSPGHLHQSVAALPY